MKKIISKFFIVLKILAILFLISPSISNAEDSMCKGLKRIDNLDDLLYQMYINLDSDCLFKMPVAELEEIWGIKIYAWEELKRIWEEKKDQQKFFTEFGVYAAEIEKGPEFRGKAYRTEIDSFYLQKWILGGSSNQFVEFVIKITDDAFKKNGTLFPGGNFPTLLPRPEKYQTTTPSEPISQPEMPKYKLRTEPAVLGEYSPHHYYYWIGKNNKSVGAKMYIQTKYSAEVEEIRIRSNY